jgi:hypothetical protein
VCFDLKVLFRATFQSAYVARLVRRVAPERPGNRVSGLGLEDIECRGAGRPSESSSYFLSRPASSGTDSTALPIQEMGLVSGRNGGELSC